MDDDTELLLSIMRQQLQRAYVLSQYGNHKLALESERIAIDALSQAVARQQ